MLKEIFKRSLDKPDRFQETSRDSTDGASKSTLTALSRNEFIENLSKQTNLSYLEIGPLNRPLLLGKNVKYFDLECTAELKIKAKNEGLDPDTVPNIDFYHNGGDLSVVEEKFDTVISSHVIEHQPDLILHLQNISKILKSESGHYSLVIPDKRYCFDALISETRITEIIEAFENKVTKPSFWKVVEHRSLTTHNDPVLHWAGNHGIPNLDLKKRWNAARGEFKESEGKYIDVHCWQFTPHSFALIIDGLFDLGYIDFKVEEIFDTPINDLEFCVILRKSQT
jgi:SAM-dependent methyltransferase